MAGDWIKMRVGLWDDPRAVRLASALKANKATVCGALYRLWALADQYTEDGRLVGYTAETLDESLAVPGFSEALRQVGWLLLEADAVVVPDFATHNGQSAKRRAQQRDRVRCVRKLCASDAHNLRTRSAPEEEGEEEARRRGREERETSSPSDVDGAKRFSEGTSTSSELTIFERIRNTVKPRSGSRFANDWSDIGKTAMLVARGRIPENDLEEVLEAIELKKPANRSSFFHKCMANKTADYCEDFNKMLASVRLPDWLPIPPDCRS